MSHIGDVLPMAAVFTVIFISACTSFVAFTLGIIAVIELRAFKKSTHQIQYMPLDNEIDKHNQKYLEKLGADPFSEEDLWATPDTAIEKQNKLYREELEEKLPEMVSSEKPEKYSF